MQGYPCSSYLSCSKFVNKTDLLNKMFGVLRYANPSGCENYAIVLRFVLICTTKG